MENYLTIGEFAKLRNVNINSLLYYEKIGVLLPEYTDPNSKYRYYSPEQLVTLDNILLCIELGIPLKDLKKYTENNTFLVHKFLEDGKQLAETKMENIKVGLKKTEYYLRCQEENKQYKSISTLYQREIKERFLVTTPYNADFKNVRKLEAATMKLFDYAQNQNLVPVLPSGVLLQYQHDKISCHIFLEILSTCDTLKTDVCKIPTASFSCIQKKLDKNTDIHALYTLIEKEFGLLENKTVLITNVKKERLRFDSMQSEIQVADTIFEI